jgi:hypothetical protein
MQMKILAGDSLTNLVLKYNSYSIYKTRTRSNRLDHPV